MGGADYVPVLSTCPRCGDKGLERLNTHSYCINCNYSTEELEDRPKAISVPDWAIEAFRQGKKVTFYKDNPIPMVSDYEPSNEEVSCA